MSRRRGPRYVSLTSLLDVLFILVFASLIQSAAMVEGAEASAAPPEEPPEEPVEEPAVDAAPASEVAPTRAELRERAVAELTGDLRRRAPIYARVAKDGTLTAIEADGSAVELRVPLLARVPDPDIAFEYLGDQSFELRVCNLIARHLGRDDLSDALVIIVPEAPLAELMIALVDGLRRDEDRCRSDAGGVAALVDPAFVAKEEPNE